MMLLNRFINCFKISSFIFVLLIVELCSCSVYWTEGGKPDTSKTNNDLSMNSDIGSEDAKELDQIFNSLDLNQNSDSYSENDDLLLTSFENNNVEDNNTDTVQNSDTDNQEDNSTNLTQNKDTENISQNDTFELDNSGANNSTTSDYNQLPKPEDIGISPSTNVNSVNDDQNVVVPSLNVDSNLNSNPHPFSLSRDDKDSTKDGIIIETYMESLRKSSHHQSNTKDSPAVNTKPQIQDQQSTNTNVDNSNIVVDTNPPQIPTYLPRPEPRPVPQPKNIEITDQHVCASLRHLEKNASLLPNFSATNLANFKRAVSYFCNNNAENLKLLRANSYTGIEEQKNIFVDTVFDLQGKEGSYLATATASTEPNVKLDVFPYISSSYCEGFDIYKRRYGEANVKEIDFIKILDNGRINNNMFNSKWCSFHLKSKPVFFVLVPEYKGILIHNMYLNNNLFIELNYTIEPISLVKDFLAISIAYNRPDGTLNSYSYRYVASIKTSFHSTLVKSTIDKAKDIAKKRFEVNRRLNARF